jgi:heme exporter protein A
MTTTTAAPAEPAILLRWTTLTRRFGSRVLFRDLSGEARRGRALAVTGPNGSGKSTLLRILAGLARPSAGRVEWATGGGELRHVLGYASPDLQLYRELTARENLDFFGRLLDRDPGQTSRRLSEVGLRERDHDKLVALFSSGMLQRLRLAFALLADPAILLLDEPGSNLDDEGRTLVDEVVGRQRERGTVLIATNDPREAALADETVALG